MTFLQKIRGCIITYIPEWILLGYHFILSLFSLLIYRFPSNKLIVIGVTGTKGKTSTAIAIHDTLTAVGAQVGLLSTAAFSTGGVKIQNTHHMTMPGRFFVQQQLRKMVDTNCQFVVVETTSEGIRQFRNFGITYDALVFTNLSPEHLQTHKTFEKYRDTKGRLFQQFGKKVKKCLDSKTIDRFVLVNADDNHAEHFLQLVDTKDVTRIRFGVGEKSEVRAVVREVGNIIGTTVFTVDGVEYRIGTVGTFAIQNVLPAIILAQRYYPNTSPETIVETLARLQLPGRMELLKEGQSFSVLLDYAHEPLSVRCALQAARKYVRKGGRLISLVGAVGGGRWRFNAKEMGMIARKLSDITIFTQNDPEFDDPSEILDAMVIGAKRVTTGTYQTEVDRQKAIHCALEYAKPGDVVLIAGKGVEVTAKTAQGTIAWNEREIVRTALHTILRG